MTADGSASRLSFSPQEPKDGSSVWARRLLLDGKDAFDLGISCDTCAFFFERMPGADESVSPGEAVSTALRAGIDGLDPDLLAAVGSVVPAGEYEACLLEHVPTIVWPGDEHDYFCREQVELFGIDPFWGIPNTPRTPYYRCGDSDLGSNERLFEFVVPFVPPRWLDADTVDAYRSGGGDGTGLAVGVLDVKAPFGWDGDTGPYRPAFAHDATAGRHWCVAHFLLDGHHKLYAAALERRSVRLVSLISRSESIAIPHELTQAVAAL